ncbi:MAG TPA: glycosyltransferase family 39 protein [Blastocatellia bacterium]
MRHTYTILGAERSKAVSSLHSILKRWSTLARSHLPLRARRVPSALISVGRLINTQRAMLSAGLLLSFSSLLLGIGISMAPDRAVAVLVGVIPVSLCLWVILRDKTDRLFLFRLFVAALLLRWVVAFAIHDSNQQAFFGGDALTYDAFGNELKQSWLGLVDAHAPWLTRYTTFASSGWGMFYYVASVYYVIGQNSLAIQLVNAGLGAALCIGAYKVATMIYPNQRVARAAALFTAFSPSMILWSSQALKDAPIAMCLVLCALYTLKLRHRFNTRSFLLLLVFMFCLFSLRHYAFYIVFAVTAATFLIARGKLTPLRVLQGGLLVLVIGLAFAYIGAGNTAQQAFDLKHIQEFREWGARVTNTGFGGDVDITDPRAAVGFLPIGILYVLLAPFPWMINNLRQLITLPELLAWWAMIPLLVKGYWFGVRHRLRESFAVLLFIVSLVFAYALYQSNAGTAYRHRAQLYPFFFVLMGIGLELRRNKRELRSRGVPHDGIGLEPALAVGGTSAPNPPSLTVTHVVTGTEPPVDSGCATDQVA